MSNDDKKNLPLGGSELQGDEWDSVLDAWEKTAFSDKHFDETALAAEAQTAADALEPADGESALAGETPPAGVMPPPVPAAAESIVYVAVADDEPESSQAPRGGLEPEVASLDGVLDAAPSSELVVPSEQQLDQMFPVGRPFDSLELPALTADGELPGEASSPAPIDGEASVDEQPTEIDAAVAPRLPSFPPPAELENAHTKATARMQPLAQAAVTEPPIEIPVFEETSGAASPLPPSAVAEPDAVVRAPSIPPPLPPGAVAEPDAVVRTPSIPPPLPPSAVAEPDAVAAAPSVPPAPPAPLPQVRGPLHDAERLQGIPLDAEAELTFEQEQLAAEVLPNEVRRALGARAAWLAEEAQHLQSADAQARTLLVASELLALSGDAHAAEEHAEQAAERAPELEMVQRQLRAFAGLRDDDSRVLSLLRQEQAQGSTEDARAHAGLLALRIEQRRGDLELPALRQQARALPHREASALALFDVALERAHAAELGHDFAHSALRAPWSQLGEWLGLGGAKHTEEAASPELLWRRALHAVRAVAAWDSPLPAGTDALPHALPALAALREAATELAPALAAWTPLWQDLAHDEGALAGLAALPTEAGRDRVLALALLEHCQSDSGREAAGPSLLALCEESTELNDADKLALRALAKLPQPRAERDPLRSALSALGLLDAGAESNPTGATSAIEAGELAQQLAQAIARGDSLAPYESLWAESELQGSVRAARAQWLRSEGRGDEAATVLLGGERAVERLASALLAEVAHRPETARRHFAAAASAEPRWLAAARAARSLDPEARASLDDSLREQLLAAASAAEPNEQPALWLELLARGELSPTALDAGAREQLLEQLLDAEPAPLWASPLALLEALRRGDRDALLRWLERREGLPLDPREHALDAATELMERAVALRLEPGEASVHEDACRAAAAKVSAAEPAALSARDLFEMLQPELPADAASWRIEHAAAQAAQAAQARTALRLDAALLSESPRAAQQLLASEPDSPWARAATERLAFQGGDSQALAERLMAEARDAQDATQRIEAYQRLAELDRWGRGDVASALLWHRTVLEEQPDNLTSLRYVEHALLSEARLDELEPIASTLAGHLAALGEHAGEAHAHADLAVRVRLRGADAVWSQASELVELAAGLPAPTLQSLRLRNAHARFTKDDPALLETTSALLERTDAASMDRATLLCRSAEAYARLGHAEDAREALEQAVVADPGDVVAWGMLVEARDATGDRRGAAAACEELARSSSVDGHRLVALHEAGTLWLSLKDDEHAERALEQASQLDPSEPHVFEQLSELYARRGDGGRLAELIERRLVGVQHDGERIALEVDLGRALERMGELQPARAALERALDLDPDHVDALKAHGDVALRLGDYAAAEEAWLRLSRKLTSSEAQGAIYEQLGTLYMQHALNLPRAEAAWKEVLRRAPEHEAALLALVEVHRQQQDLPQMVEVFERYLKLAADSDERQRRLIELAKLYEEAQQPRKAEQVLESARREFPTAVLPLRSLAEFYLRQRQIPAMNILLDRASADARRGVAAGRFTSAVFQTLGTAAELRKNVDATRVVAATVAAFEGRAAHLDGAGLRAADPRLDDLLAPELISPALRGLLTRAGDALDHAAPLDLRALGASPPNASQQGAVQMLVQAAQQLGLHQLQVAVTPRLGRVCLPVSSNPPVLLVGEALLSASHDKARAFLVMRALKLLYMRASSLVRASAADLPVLVGAWVKAFNPNWVAPGLNAAAVAEMGRKVAAGLPNQSDPSLGVMALEAAAALGTQASHLGAATLNWANRAALLAVGDPGAALDAVAWGLGQDTLPTEREARAAWLSRTQDARELLAFSVSDPYLEARRRLGLIVT